TVPQEILAGRLEIPSFVENVVRRQKRLGLPENLSPPFQHTGDVLSRSASPLGSRRHMPDDQGAGFPGSESHELRHSPSAPLEHLRMFDQVMRRITADS